MKRTGIEEKESRENTHGVHRNLPDVPMHEVLPALVKDLPTSDARPPHLRLDHEGFRRRFPTVVLFVIPIYFV
jgi:hypothetical protein